LNFFSQTIELSIAQSMAADFVSADFEVEGFELGGVVADWTGANKTTALLIPQFSIDRVCWCNFVSEANAQRVDGPTGCKMYEFDHFSFKYMRMRFAAKTNTAGSVTIKLYVKRPWGQNR
jgi:hypothetical protein